MIYMLPFNVAQRAFKDTVIHAKIGRATRRGHWHHTVARCHPSTPTDAIKRTCVTKDHAERLQH